MSDFRTTQLWRSTLGLQNNDPYADVRERLRSTFERFRDRAGVLAAEIAKDLPDLTVHDLTHIDALWGIADSVVGTTVILNPAEAFVLGGAFLIHDVAMSVAAFPGGIAGLQERTEWNDFITGALTRKLDREPTVDELSNAPSDVVNEATFWILTAWRSWYGRGLSSTS